VEIRGVAHFELIENKTKVDKEHRGRKIRFGSKRKETPTVQLDREGRLFWAMIENIWLAIETVDDDEEKKGHPPLTSLR
jgi:hypothetical protein